MNNHRDARKAKLEAIFNLTVDAVIRALSDPETPPSASMIEAARKVLADNQCTLDQLIAWRSGLGFDPANLPTFDDPNDDHTAGPSEADPLRKIAPFGK
jgi:hypothetical protein